MRSAKSKHLASGSKIAARTACAELVEACFDSIRRILFGCSDSAQHDI